VGILYLVATPIGNLEDMSPRALRVLRQAGLIAAEDTRLTGRLLKHFEIATPLTSYFEHNKLQKIDRVLEALAAGDAALVSDAGMPAINDPGYELVGAALASGFDVRPVPGPSAPIAALAVSGLPTDSFLYLGYLPHKAGERRKKLQEAASQPYTLIFLESPHRIVQTLKEMLATLGDRRIAVAREMTKLFEEYWRGEISGALEYFKSKPARGEFTLVVQGRTRKAPGRWTEARLQKAIDKELKRGKSARDLSTEYVEPSGWKRRDIYRLITKDE
jgi:16S rRNA (cytidine1402-2'-O)-methyltransferase